MKCKIEKSSKLRCQAAPDDVQNPELRTAAGPYPMTLFAKNPLSYPPPLAPTSSFVVIADVVVIVVVVVVVVDVVGATTTQLMKALEKKKEQFGHKFSHDMSFTR